MGCGNDPAAGGYSITKDGVLAGEVRTAGALELGRWAWVCVSHTKQSLWRSRAEVYVNAELVASERLHYPKAVELTPLTRAVIGSYSGQLSRVVCVGAALSAAQARVRQSAPFKRI